MQAENTDTNRRKPQRLILLLLGLAGLFGAWGGLNTTGFCFDEMRYIPDAEFFARYVGSIKSFIRPELYQVRNWTKDQTVKSFVTYKDGKDYILHNPDCCSYGRQKSVDQSRLFGPTLLQRFFGTAWGIVEIHHRLQFTNGLGEKKEYWTPHIQNLADSCGHYVKAY